MSHDVTPAPGEYPAIPWRYHHHPEQIELSRREVAEELSGWTLRPYSRTLILVLAIMAIIGIIGLIMRLVGGFANRAAWGYYAAFFVFLMSTAGAAPVVAWMTRFAKGAWGRPIRRISEMYSAVMILTVLMFIPLLFTLPPLQGRPNIWFDWPVGAPYLWDFLAVLGQALFGWALLYFSSLPDMASVASIGAADRTGRQRGWSRGFSGTTREWKVLTSAQVILGSLYLMYYVQTMTLIAYEFSQSLVPGWKSAIYGGYTVVTSLQAGLALTLIGAYALRRWGGLSAYIRMDQFWSASKILLALTLFWFYFFWADFLIQWYGRQPQEQGVDSFLTFGPYRGAFIGTALFCFLIPFLSLIWNGLRQSVIGPTLVSCSIVFGDFLDRIRLYVAAYTANPFAPVITPDTIPPTHWPDLWDVCIWIGGFGGAILLVLWALSITPPISTWEIKEGMLLRQIRPFLKSRIAVIAKPW